MTALAAAQGPARTATVTVDASRVENHVSSGMYAAFVEMMAEDVKWGMTAEMLHDRSFEEPADYLGLPARWQFEPDERNDIGGAIRFMATTDEAYPKVNAATGAAEHSLRIRVDPGDVHDSRLGFSQGRLSARAGKTYKGYVWAKLPEKNGYTGEIKVALEQDVTDGRSYAQATLSGIAGDWRQYSFALTPTQTDRFAKLSFLFTGRGTLFLDQVSLEPAAAQSQVRPDSEAMIRELHPSFMRWPGGNVAQDYHWQWGIGPRDLRPTWINKAWSNAPEPGDLGTDEYLALCDRLHIEPSITVNVDGAGATPEEAAAWVEYVNGPATSKYGAMRAANGHPQPYGVKQWELGNEIFGDWVRGHVTATQYSEAAVRYAKAMRAVDPTIKLIAVGEGVFPGSDAWNTAVLKTAGAEIQYLAVHDYTSIAQNAAEPNPAAAMMRRASEYEANYRHMGDLIKQIAPGSNIKLIVNEWNLFYGASTIEGMEGAIYASRMMNGFERDGNIVAANAISDLLNGWGGGVIQASRDRVYGTAEYWAVKMYADHLGTDRLHAEVKSPELQAGVPAIDAVSTRSADGSKIFIKLSNADKTQPISTTVEVEQVRVRRSVELEVLKGSAGSRLNTFEQPDLIKPATKHMTCDRKCTVTVAPESILIMTLSSAP
jgi:alpha-N-arabinofuranosidase